MLRTCVESLHRSTISEVFRVWLGGQPQRSLWHSSVLLSKKASGSDSSSSSSDSDSDVSELGAGLDPKLKEAAEGVAQSAPPSQGPALQSDLLQQLQSASKLSQDQAAGVPSPASSDQAATKLSGLLSQMQVQKPIQRGKQGDEGFGQARPRSGRLPFKRQLFPQPEREKVKLFEGPALGIFTSADAAPPTQETVAAQEVPEERWSLWEQVQQEQLDMFRRRPPSNAFEEMIQWTQEGKLWHYPINNEQGLEEEAEVGFHRHVFLEGQIGDFPRRGPIRHFMELVLVGLSKNPHLTVQQKTQHIDWFRQYFKEKEEVLREALGDDGLMAATAESSS